MGNYNVKLKNTTKRLNQVCSFDNNKFVAEDRINRVSLLAGNLALLKSLKLRIPVYIRKINNDLFISSYYGFFKLNSSSIIKSKENFKGECYYDFLYDNETNTFLVIHTSKQFKRVSRIDYDLKWKGILLDLNNSMYPVTIKQNSLIIDGLTIKTLYVGFINGEIQEYHYYSNETKSLVKTHSICSDDDYNLISRILSYPNDFIMIVCQHLSIYKLYEKDVNATRKYTIQLKNPGYVVSVELDGLHIYA